MASQVRRTQVFTLVHVVRKLYQTDRGAVAETGLVGGAGRTPGLSTAFVYTRAPFETACRIFSTSPAGTMLNSS